MQESCTSQHPVWDHSVAPHAHRKTCVLSDFCSHCGKNLYSPFCIQAPLLLLCFLGEVQAKRRTKKGVRSAKTYNFSWLVHAKTHRVFPPLFWKVCYVRQAVSAQRCCMGHRAALCSWRLEKRLPWQHPRQRWGCQAGSGHFAAPLLPEGAGSCRLCHVSQTISHVPLSLVLSGCQVWILVGVRSGSFAKLGFAWGAAGLCSGHRWAEIFSVLPLLLTSVVASYPWLLQGFIGRRTARD